MEFLRTISNKYLRLDSGTSIPKPCPFKNVTELNDSVYELYKPPKDPKVEIIFFHGLQYGDHSNSYWSTWRTADNEELWPQTWLPEVIPDARVLSVSYDTSLKTSQQGTLDLHTIGSQLIQSLIVLAQIGQKRRCPIVLVGHSFGGLVIKQFCVEAQSEQNSSPDAAMIRQFLKNVKGCFFYATPHHGVPFNMAGNFIKGPLLDYVKLLSTDSARLGEDFRRLYSQLNWEIAGVGEAYETRMGYFRGIVVPEASAREGSFCTVEADHISVCKPKGKFSSIFQRLTTFVQNIMDKQG